MNYNRFDYGTDYEYIDNLTNEELAQIIRDLDCWEQDLNRELVWRADKIEPGLFERYMEAEAEDAERIVEKAADILHVEIY